jgi:hypothetical protein
MADEENELKIVARASSAAEAVMVCGRLTEAGIRTMRGAGRWGSGRDVYVKEQDLERSREVLKADEGGFSEEELARLSDEAGGMAAEEDSSSAPTQLTPPNREDERGEPDEPVETRTPTKRHVFGVFERIVRRTPEADASDNPFGH